jgi:membrane-bound serine protease (ClpP class)
MLGALGTGASAAGDGTWWIAVHGEHWRARSSAALNPGCKVKVVRMDGLTLDVAPTDTPTTTGSTS